MLVIPLQAVPSQKVKTVLDDLIMNIWVYQLRTGMFINVYMQDEMMIGGVICQNKNRIIRSEYINRQFGFSGDFMFVDTQGDVDPIYQGLGTDGRFQLVYLTADELISYGYLT